MDDEGRCTATMEKERCSTRDNDGGGNDDNNSNSNNNNDSTTTLTVETERVDCLFVVWEVVNGRLFLLLWFL